VKGYIVVIELRTETKVIDSHHYELERGGVNFASLADLKHQALGDMGQDHPDEGDIMFAHISGIYPVESVMTIERRRSPL
jgi:hypothetical protein